MIQGQPRHGPVLAGHPDSLGDRVDVGQDAAVGEHHALRIRGGPARELQDRETVGIVGGADEPLGRQPGCLRDELVEANDGGAFRGRIEERRELGVDDEHVGVGALDAPQGLVDELFDRAETHRERQGDDGGAGEPDRLQRGDESRDVGPMMATCAPGSTPRACNAAAIARASSWSRAHSTRSTLASPAAEPTKVTVPGPSAAASRRADTEGMAGSTHAGPRGLRAEKPVNVRHPGSQ